MNISDFLLRFKTFRAAQYHNKSGFRNQEVPDQRIEIMTRSDELPERSPGRTKGIKLCDAQTTFCVSATEVGKFSLQLFYQPGLNWFVDA